MQCKTLECKHLEGPGLCSPDTSFLFCFNLSTVPPQVSFMSSVTSTGWFVFFPQWQKIFHHTELFPRQQQMLCLALCALCKVTESCGSLCQLGLYLHCQNPALLQCSVTPLWSRPGTVVSSGGNLQGGERSPDLSQWRSVSLCVSAGVWQHSWCTQSWRRARVEEAAACRKGQPACFASPQETERGYSKPVHPPALWAEAETCWAGTGDSSALLRPPRPTASPRDPSHKGRTPCLCASPTPLVFLPSSSFLLKLWSLPQQAGNTRGE